jgi:uncharacterized Tic20 family protein
MRDGPEQAGASRVATAAAPAAPYRPSAAERVLAAAAHVLLLLSVPGLLLATVIWLTQRRRSVYVATQARMAVIWQLVSNVLLGVVIALLLGLALSQFGGILNTHNSSDGGAITRMFGSLVGLYVVLVLAVLYFGIAAVIGALSALLGRDYHYPFIGRRHKRQA